MFKYNEKRKKYYAELDGIKFCCKELKAHYERYAFELATQYEVKLPEIVAFMLEDVSAIYGDLDIEQLTHSLGSPLIDLDREMICYLEHSLDNCHIIEVEFGGFFEHFYEVVIDG